MDSLLAIEGTLKLIYLLWRVKSERTIERNQSSVLGGKGGGDLDLGPFETGTLLSIAMGKSPTHITHTVKIT